MQPTTVCNMFEANVLHTAGRQKQLTMAEFVQCALFTTTAQAIRQFTVERASERERASALSNAGHVTLLHFLCISCMCVCVCVRTHIADKPQRSY